MILLTLLKKIEVTDETGVLDSYKDKGEIKDYAKTSIDALVNEGYITGNDGFIKPLDNTTRAEVAVFLNRILNAE